MKTLFVSDLDGTLLNSKSRLSTFTKDVVNQLVHNGLHFTYATARSLSSASVVTKGLSIKLPVITYNGTIIFDASSGEILASNSFQPEEVATVVELLRTYGISPFVYSFLEQVEKVTWMRGSENVGMTHYLSLRKGDKRLRPVTYESKLYEGNVFYITCIGSEEQLRPLYKQLVKDSRYTCTLQQEPNRDEYWCEIMPRKASKAEGIRFLKRQYGFDRVVSFGDAINDIPMFRCSEEAYAVANAVDALKSEATGMIESNDEDGVAKFLLRTIQ